MVVLCGSSFSPFTHRNPWSFDDKEAMILAALDSHAAARVNVLLESPYNVQSVQKLVGDAVQACLAATPEIALIGHCRNDSGYVVNMFPQWQSIKVDTLPGIDGTAIRSSQGCRTFSAGVCHC